MNHQPLKDDWMSQAQRSKMLHRLSSVEEEPYQKEVLDALLKVPRHCFVSSALAHSAYREERTLPIGFKQTISRVQTVARMLSLLIEKASSFDEVLEIGGGSGYQAAVLSHLFSQVLSLERIDALAKEAKRKLGIMGYRNVQLQFEDGASPSLQKRSFGAIVVACQTKETGLFSSLLKEGGVLVLPFQTSTKTKLVRILKKDGILHQEHFKEASFVPLLKGKVL